MKFKATLSCVAMILVSNTVCADQAAYYSIEELTVQADGANYGPFPSALSEDGAFIATYSMKASLSNNIDIGLPLTFNRKCQYDTVICQLQFYGSESAEQLSYENAYQVWRNAQADAVNGYSRYFMANTLLSGSDEAQIPYAPGESSSDVRVTDVTNPLASERFVVGYSSAPYQDGSREFVRRAFIKGQSGGNTTSLLPDFTGNGGFSSAYKLQQVTYENGESKTLVIGAASLSYPRSSDEYFQKCFFSNESDEISTLNELLSCPGFDTQAWAWDVTQTVAGETADVVGYPLATHWLEDNSSNNGRYLTFSAGAFDINKSGVAVGASSFEYQNSELGARQRAIIMTPSESGAYAKPIVIAAATADIGSSEDQERGIYNTWAQAITDSNIVVGNREYAIAKGRNIPFEFFVYDINSASIKFPLMDKKVLTTEQRLAGEDSTKIGANSLAYDINDAGFVVGEADDYDQKDPVYLASPRSQTAFLYDNNSGQSWLINDLLCTQTDDVVSSPYVRIRSARVISADGTVLAEGFKYNTVADYKNKINATPAAFKLIRNEAVARPSDSPNCWESELLKSEEIAYERGGAAGFWLWILALPLLLVRRFGKY